MKKELNTYDAIKGLSEFEEWSYCTNTNMWYEDATEILPQPLKESEPVSDFILEVKVDYDGMYCDDWNQVEREGMLKEFARYVIGEFNGEDCLTTAVFIKTNQQTLITTFLDYGLYELEQFINKLKEQSFAAEYMEDAELRKFIAWTDENNQTRFIVYSYRECSDCWGDKKEVKILIDITVNREVLIRKLETIIESWKEAVRTVIKEQETALGKKAENPYQVYAISYFLPEFNTPANNDTTESKSFERKFNDKNNNFKTWIIGILYLLLAILTFYIISKLPAI